MLDLTPADWTEVWLFLCKSPYNAPPADAFREFTEAIQDVPEVEECYLVAGNFDYLIKARVKDMTEYREFLGGSLMQLPGVQESTSYPVMEKAAERTVTGL